MVEFLPCWQALPCPHFLALPLCFLLLWALSHAGPFHPATSNSPCHQLLDISADTRALTLTSSFFPSASAAAGATAHDPTSSFFPSASAAAGATAHDPTTSFFPSASAAAGATAHDPTSSFFPSASAPSGLHACAPAFPSASVTSGLPTCAPTFSAFPSASATAGVHACAPTFSSFSFSSAPAGPQAPVPTRSSFFSASAAAGSHALAPTCSSFSSTSAAGVTNMHAHAPTLLTCSLRPFLPPTAQPLVCIDTQHRTGVFCVFLLRVQPRLPHLPAFSSAPLSFQGNTLPSAPPSCLIPGVAACHPLLLQRSLCHTSSPVAYAASHPHSFVVAHIAHAAPNDPPPPLHPLILYCVPPSCAVCYLCFPLLPLLFPNSLALGVPPFATLDLGSSSPLSHASLSCFPACSFALPFFQGNTLPSVPLVGSIHGMPVSHPGHLPRSLFHTPGSSPLACAALHLSSSLHSCPAPPLSPSQVPFALPTFPSSPSARLFLQETTFLGPFPPLPVLTCSSAPLFPWLALCATLRFNATFGSPFHMLIPLPPARSCLLSCGTLRHSSTATTALLPVFNFPPPWRTVCMFSRSLFLLPLSLTMLVRCLGVFIFLSLLPVSGLSSKLLRNLRPCSQVSFSLSTAHARICPWRRTFSAPGIHLPFLAPTGALRTPPLVACHALIRLLILPHVTPTHILYCAICIRSPALPHTAPMHSFRRGICICAPAMPRAALMLSLLRAICIRGVPLAHRASPAHLVRRASNFPSVLSAIASRIILFFSLSVPRNRDFYVVSSPSASVSDSSESSSSASFASFWQDAPGQHSPLVGFLADGIPLYGPRGVGGALPSGLDECGGHVGDGSGGEPAFYHYHASSTAPYTVACLKGCVSSSDWATLGSTSCSQASSEWL
ncbi:unnamed protein product [Closterium sp. NIES-64]|nr:unnamed protein product [Closterium sp. NIES-64]